MQVLTRSKMSDDVGATSWRRDFQARSCAGHREGGGDLRLASLSEGTSGRHHACDEEKERTINSTIKALPLEFIDFLPKKRIT